MKKEMLFRIKAVYLFGLALFTVTLMIGLHSSTRAVLLLVAYTPILVLHVQLSIVERTWQTKKAFFLLSLMWVVKYSLFAFDELRYFWERKSILLLSWLDLALLLGVFAFVAHSFLSYNPFYYIKVHRSGTILAIGLLLLTISVIGVVMGVLLFLSSNGYYGFSLIGGNKM